MKLREARSGETRDAAPGAVPAGVLAVRDGDVAWVAFRGETYRIAKAARRARRAAEEEHELTAPMPGKVLAVRVTEGQEVAKGDVLVVLEAMKMEHAIRSPRAGAVARVFVEAGKMVGLGDVLLDVT